MKQTGKLLKDKRESTNLSLSEVALATKINPKILSAIESGDEKNLPAKTFLKGFVRSYALFLKMDVDEVMRVFTGETGGPPAAAATPDASKSEPQVPASSGKRKRSHEENSSGLRTAAVIVIVLLIGAIIGVRELIEKYQREKVVEVPADLKATPVQTPTTPEPAVNTAVDESTEAPETAKTATMVAESAKTEAAKVEATKRETPDAKSVEVAATKAEEPKPVLPVPPAPPVVATPTILSLSKPAPLAPKTEVKSAEPEKTVASKPAEAKAEVKPTDAKPAEAKPTDPSAPVEPSPRAELKAARNEIILEALDKVDVKFQVAGETKRVSLAPEQVHTIRADEPVVLDFSDGGAVNIIFNGRERGPPGDLGKPKQVKLP